MNEVTLTCRSRWLRTRFGTEPGFLLRIAQWSATATHDGRWAVTDRLANHGEGEVMVEGREDTVDSARAEAVGAIVRLQLGMIP